MKKITLCLIAALALAGAQSAQAQLLEVDNDSLTVSVTFGANPNGQTGDAALAVYGASTGGSVITTYAATGAGYTANTNKQVVLKSASGFLYVEVKPLGFYELNVYTANLDPDLNKTIEYDNNSASPTYLQLTGVDIHGAISLPAAWNDGTLTLNQKANWNSSYAGLVHGDFRHVLPIKVWSAGANVGEDVTDYLEADAFTIKATAWDGDGASFSYVPESSAVDTGIYTQAQLDAILNGNPAWGSAVKTIAGTMLGSNIEERLQVAFGLDMKFAGKGTYSGDVYLELKSN